jgi:hypothetical protein
MKEKERMELERNDVVQRAEDASQTLKRLKLEMQGTVVAGES